MTAILIVLCTLGGSLLGGVTGFVIGEAEGGDFNFAPVIYGPVGLAIGAVGGALIGALIFA